MRVLTQNLFGRRADWAARRHVLVDGLRELKPDLIAFQEAIVNPQYDQVADLVGPDFHIFHQKVREPASADGDVEARQGISIT